MKFLFILSALFLMLSCFDLKKSDVPQSQPHGFDWAIKKFPNINKNPAHEVLTLGVFHFDRSGDGSDVVAKNHIDVSSEDNQKELDYIIEKLKEFSPARIAVEWRPQHQKVLDSLYQEYKSGNYVLGKNEAFQIGFRLAKMLGHQKVYCVDNNPPMPETINQIDDWEVYADSLGHLELWHSYDKENSAYNTFMDTIQKHLNIKEYLQLINSPQNSVRTKQLWTTGLVDVGHSDKFLGADLLGRWYRRNTRIYVSAKNLIAPNSNENLLIIYGGAHKWILDELFESSPEFQVKQFNDLVME